MAKGLKLLSLSIYLILLCHGQGNELELRSCEPLLQVPICTPLGYPNTSFPNHKGHKSQQQASAELDAFQPLISSGCSVYLRHFLCAYYVPFCKDILPQEMEVPPCKELCLHVRTHCESVLNDYGYEWPIHLYCNYFPTKSETPWCFGPDDPSQLENDTGVSSTAGPLPSMSAIQVNDGNTDKVSTTSSQSSLNVINYSNVQPKPSVHTQVFVTYQQPMLVQPSIPAVISSAPKHTQTNNNVPGTHATPIVSHTVCESIPTDSICHGLDYEKTGFPNLRGHMTWQEAENELKQYDMFIMYHCSPHLVQFLCYYYLPQCRDNPPTIMKPCRELCLEVQESCLSTINIFKLNWPRNIDCSNLPSQNDQEECSSPNMEVTIETTPGDGKGHSFLPLPSLIACLLVFSLSSFFLKF